MGIEEVIAFAKEKQKNDIMVSEHEIIRLKKYEILNNKYSKLFELYLNEEKSISDKTNIFVLINTIMFAAYYVIFGHLNGNNNFVDYIFIIGLGIILFGLAVNVFYYAITHLTLMKLENFKNKLVNLESDPYFSPYFHLNDEIFNKKFTVSSKDMAKFSIRNDKNIISKIIFFPYDLLSIHFFNATYKNTHTYPDDKSRFILVNRIPRYLYLVWCALTVFHVVYFIFAIKLGW